jgi:hypothetical protein
MRCRTQRNPKRKRELNERKAYRIRFYPSPHGKLATFFLPNELVNRADFPFSEDDVLTARIEPGRLIIEKARIL